MSFDGVRLTLAVYKQIKLELLIDSDTCQLRGTPLGVVNYCDPDEHSLSEHLHVVWKKGNELRQDTIKRDWPAAREYSSRIERLAGERQTELGPPLRLIVLARTQRGHPPSADGVHMVVNVNGRRFTYSDHGLSNTIAALRSSDKKVRTATEKRIRAQRAQLLEDLVTKAMGTGIASALPDENELAPLISGTEKDTLFRKGVVESVARASEKIAVLLLDHALTKPDPAVGARQAMDRLHAAYDRQYQILANVDQLFIAG